MTNLSDLLPSGGGAKEATAIASGTLPSGQTVALLSNGQIEAVSENTATASLGNVNSLGTYGTRIQIAGYYDEAQNACAIFFSGSNDYLVGVAGTISGSTITFGTVVTGYSYSTEGYSASYDTTNNKGVVLFKDSGNTGDWLAKQVNVSGTTISFESTQQVFSNHSSARPIASVFCANVDKFLVVWNSSSQGTLVHNIGEISGSSTSWAGTGGYNNFNGTNFNAYEGGWAASLTYDPVNACVLICQTYRYSPYYMSYMVVTVPSSGSATATLAQNPINNYYSDVPFAAYNVNDAKHVLAYRVASGMDVVPITLPSNSQSSFTTPTVSSGNFGPTIGNNNVRDPNGIGYNALHKKTALIYSDNLGVQYIVSLDTSGSTYSTGTNLTLQNTYIASIQPRPVLYDSVSTNMLIAFKSGASGTTYDGRTYTMEGTTTNVADFIGITSESITSGNSGKYNPQGGVATTTEPSAGETGTAVNFGVGDTADMKAVFDSGSNRVVFGYQSSSTGYAASSVAEINASNNSVSFGSVGIVQVASSSYNSITYDASADKIVQITTNPASGYYNGVANVGTVNPAGPNTISFSGLVSYTGTTTIEVQDITYDSTNQKTVICWNRSNFGESIVGTISAGAISFPTYPTGVTQWETSQNSISAVNNTFDSNAGSVVVAYQLSGIGLAIVAGQISAGSVTWGSRLSGASQGANTSMAEGGSICFDSHNNKVVIPYEDTGTNEGKAVVCTVSGTTVTAGTPVTFSTDAMQGQSIQSTFDSTLNKVIIAYIHDADSYVRIISGTVSGTSITFDTPIVVTSVGVTSSSVAIAYDSNANRSLVGYKGSTTFGAVYVTSGTQSPLTIDATYYIQSNGNITRTSTGNTEIGKAVSTTKLLLKGAS